MIRTTIQNAEKKLLNIQNSLKHVFKAWLIFSLVFLFSFDCVANVQTDEVFPRTDPTIIGGTYKMLEITDHILDANDISYWIGYGTLLGAYRHGGIIPWDDDADICIWQKDVDKLLNLESVFKKFGICFSPDVIHGLIRVYFQGAYRQFPSIDIFIFNEEEVNQENKVTICGTYKNILPTHFWLPEEVETLKKIQFGPIMLSVQGKGVLRCLFDGYGKNCLTMGAGYNHTTLSLHSAVPNTRIVDFFPAQYLEYKGWSLWNPLPNKEVSLGYLLQNSSTDCSHVLARLFDKIQINELVEFGFGFGPSFFSEQFEKFNSILSYQDAFLNDSRRDFDYKKMCEEVLSENFYEVAFLHANVQGKENLVDELFDRVPIIIVQNDDEQSEGAHWDYFVTPSNYVKMHLRSAPRTIVWVNRANKDVISALGEKD